MFRLFLAVLLLRLAAGSSPPSDVDSSPTSDVGSSPRSDVEPRRPDSGMSITETCQELKEEAQTIRREGYSAIDKADQIREQAYRVKDDAYELKEEAYDIKESAYEARSELESVLVETLALMRSQATVTSLYINEIRSTLSSMSSRMDRLEGMTEDRANGLEEKIEDRADGLEEKIEDRGNKLEQKIVELEEKLEDRSASLEEKIEEGTSMLDEKSADTLALVETVKLRQQIWLSEVRLISLYKITEESRRTIYGHDSDLVTDGQFTFEYPTHSSMRTYTQSDSSANNKLWIELGGHFRIQKIKIWNIRHCCRERLIGAHIYADDHLIGTVIEALYTYDFTVPLDNPVYASRITVHQPLARYLHIIELQVWGMGPFQQGDLFA